MMIPKCKYCSASIPDGKYVSYRCTNCSTVWCANGNCKGSSGQKQQGRTKNALCMTCKKQGGIVKVWKPSRDPTVATVHPKDGWPRTHHGRDGWWSQAGRCMRCLATPKCGVRVSWPALIRCNCSMMQGSKLDARSFFLVQNLPAPQNRRVRHSLYEKNFPMTT